MLPGQHSGPHCVSSWTSQKDAVKEGEDRANTERSGIETDRRREFEEVKFNCGVDQLVVHQGKEVILDQVYVVWDT